ncbi:MAG TPA: ABC transporter ATP-binding protein [Thermoanaerobaculia bacterium]|nr:ABC transporter ATP-binding protein [Thermoanaerobaculia bacterium]HQP86432.1 ABC transporter ATP-binding protein [Thermoanaerobaculia bacterium]
MGARVEVVEVRKSWGAGGSGGDAASAEALAGVSFVLDPGEFVALLGPSGCGKSTLLHLLGGLDRPSSGRVIVDGSDLARLSEADRDLYRRQTAATVFQLFNLLPTMTALENVALPLLLDGVPPAEADARAEGLLGEVGLAAKSGSFPWQLSGGQMQRVAVARALVASPALLLADEPTGSLDSRSGAQVLDLIAELASARRVTVLLATHSDEAARRARRALRLRDGRLER